jgi:hypothetical protein
MVRRFISGDYQGPYLPGYAPTPEEPAISFGLQRLDHAVGNVPQLLPAVNHIIGFTGGLRRGGTGYFSWLLDRDCEQYLHALLPIACCSYDVVWH